MKIFLNDKIVSYKNLCSGGGGIVVFVLDYDSHACFTVWNL